MRRAFTYLTRPRLALLDLVVVVVLWWVLTSTYDRWIKGVVVVPLLVVGGSGLWYGRWWRPKPRCEVKNCTNPQGEQVAATSVEGVKVFRRLCDPHWKLWVHPRGAEDAVEVRDRLTREWGWPGEAWWRD